MSGKAPIPPNEKERLAALRDLLVLDSEPEQLFDDIARLASEVCGAPIALLSLVDAERQWFKANVGLPGVNETPRDVAFCAHAISDDAVLEVPDAMRDARFSDNPLVTGAPDIRFYAGAPLVLPQGERVGTLCVIDRQARRLDDVQTRMLQSLATMTCHALVMRRNLIEKSLAVRSEYERALSESETRYRAIVEEQSELVSLARADGQLVYANPAYARHFGYLPAEMVGRSLFDFVEPADRAAVRARAARVLETGETASGENRMVSADGIEKWVAWTNSRQHDARQLPLLHSVGRDISVEMRARQLQQRLTATLRSVTEAIPALVSVLGADERYRFVNAAFERWWGSPRESIVGRSMTEVLGRVEYETSRPWVERVLRGETVNFEKTYPARDTTRHLSIGYIPLWRDSGMVDGFVAVVQDISRQKHEELRLLQLTQRDKLTGLLNRAGFEDHLERQIGQGGGASLALLYIDLDHFKPVNDQYGHPVGDQVLQIFAQRLQKLVRPSDAVVRLGGDEFAVVLTGVPLSLNARTVAEKAIAAAHAPFGVDGHQLRIGASVGLAFGVDPSGSWRDLVARADANLYQAKAAGRGRQAG